MRLSKTIAAGLLAGSGWVGLAVAAAPPLDRPSPPPCCADGLCYPNPQTWGWYETRWRRWPTAYLEPVAPGARPPAPLGPDIRPFEPPTAEEEDRRAPPPTAPRAEEPAAPTAEGETPRAPADRTTPSAETPRTAPLLPPQGAPTPPPATSPFDTPERGLEPRIPKLPFEDEPPSTDPFGEPAGVPTPAPTTSPFGEPTGDWDPPPSPPIGAPSKSVALTDGAADGRPTGQSTRRASQAGRPASSSDPPPALPVTLASWANN